MDFYIFQLLRAYNIRKPDVGYTGTREAGSEWKVKRKEIMWTENTRTKKYPHLDEVETT